jgi:hypothetical protein
MQQGWPRWPLQLAAQYVSPQQLMWQMRRLLAKTLLQPPAMQHHDCTGLNYSSQRPRLRADTPLLACRRCCLGAGVALRL